MKIIQTQNWETVPDHPNLVRPVSQRKAKEVFRELEDALRDAELYPDEYFLLDREFDDENAEFPVARDIVCYAQWGGNEGIYLEVELLVFDENSKAYRRKNFATGKTLAEDTASFDRMQYIAGYVYKLFAGEHQTPARYVLVENEKKNLETLFTRVAREYREYLLTNLVHKQMELDEVTDQIALRSAIVHELPKCLLPEDKVKELIESENALDLLAKICEPIIDWDADSINEMVSSCDSFHNELERMAKKHG